MLVYIYTFPNGKKYVGQTVLSVNQRSKRGEGYISSPYVYNAIKKYGWDNILIETFPCSSVEEMNAKEQYYIQLFNTTNKEHGYNLTLGGDGVKKYDYDVIADQWNKGKSITEIANTLNCCNTTVTDALKAMELYDPLEVHCRRYQTDAFKGVISNLKNYYSTEEHQRERQINGLKGAEARSKQIIVFDKNGEKIGVFRSGREAAKQLNITHSSPSYAINHNHFSSGYYFFIYNGCDSLNDYFDCARH